MWMEHHDVVQPVDELRAVHTAITATFIWV
jgi:hypothetical protein